MIHKKGQNNSDTKKNNKRLKVFLLFLTLSLLFWLLIKLSKDYISDVEFNLVYTDIPQSKLLHNDPDQKIVLTVKTVGFKLLKYGLKPRTLNYSLDEMEFKKKSDLYFSLTKSNINFLQAQLSAETTVLKVEPDTLFFDLGVKKSKKVKVITHIKINFKPGFNLTKQKVINPSTIVISGPSKAIDTIYEVHTEEFELKDVSDSFEEKIKLVNPSNAISLSINEIVIKGKVEKITQGTFILPYRVINLPKKYLISSYPKEVKVVFQVALNDYNKISENSFKIQCDYKHTADNNLDYLIPKIVEKPDILFDVKVIPNKIEYLIKK